MKLKILIFAGLLMMTHLGIAQEKALSNDLSTVLKKGQKEYPLFGVKRIGIGHDMELQVHPLLFFLDPHIGLKKYWGNKNKWHISSRHTLNYPTILLKTISREGTGGVLPKTSVIPQIFSTKNEIQVAKALGDQFRFTAILGLELAATLGDSDFPTIDLPFAYRRTAVYHDHFLPYFGLQLEGDLTPELKYELAFTAYKIMNDTGGFTFEDKVILYWKKSRKFGLKAGLASAFGKYPFGNDIRWMPLVDFVWTVGSRVMKI